MNTRQKDSLLWGLVGGFAFLVLVQGYELATGQGVAALVKLGVAVAVVAVAALVTHLLRPRLADDGTPADARE